MKQKRTIILLLVAAFALSGCKLRLLVNNSALVKGTTNWCLVGQLCVYQVSDTTFDERYVGEGINDQLVFTHWRGGDRHLCPNSPSPCHLSTASFDQDPRLLAILASDQVFFLEPVVARIQNANYPEAKPVQSEHDNYLIGEWKRDNLNGARDTFALVANGDSTINLNMHDLTADMHLAILLPDTSDPLNQTPSANLVSMNPGLTEENLSLQVSAGDLYFIQVYPASDEVTEARYSIHVEVAEETLPDNPPDKLAGTYNLQSSDASQSCNDTSAPEQPLLPADLLLLNNQARSIGRPVQITLDSGRMADLVNAATRYDDGSGTYLDRASYRMTDGSNDTITWMVAGQFTDDGAFDGQAYSWGTFRSRNIRCATYARLGTG